jgi:hypothetical protein
MKTFGECDFFLAHMHSRSCGCRLPMWPLTAVVRAGALVAAMPRRRCKETARLGFVCAILVCAAGVVGGGGQSAKSQRSTSTSRGTHSGGTAEPADDYSDSYEDGYDDTDGYSSTDDGADRYGSSGRWRQQQHPEAGSGLGVGDDDSQFHRNHKSAPASDMPQGSYMDSSGGAGSFGSDGSHDPYGDGGGSGPYDGVDLQAVSIRVLAGSCEPAVVDLGKSE